MGANLFQSFGTKKLARRLFGKRPVCPRIPVPGFPHRKRPVCPRILRIPLAHRTQRVIHTTSKLVTKVIKAIRATIPSRAAEKATRRDSDPRKMPA
jgi:hypothetical protein